MAMAGSMIEVSDYAWDKDYNRTVPTAARFKPRRAVIRALIFTLLGGCVLLGGIHIAGTAGTHESPAIAVSAQKLVQRPPTLPSVAIATETAPSPERPASIPAAIKSVEVEAADPGAETSREPLEKLPVGISVTHGRKMIKVEIASSSPDNLTITIQAVNQATHKSTVMNLDLAPYEQRLITGSDMDLASGDLLTLHNPQFADQSAMIF